MGDPEEGDEGESASLFGKKSQVVKHLGVHMGTDKDLN